MHIMQSVHSEMHMQVGSPCMATLITMCSIPSRVTGASVSSSAGPMVTADITHSYKKNELNIVHF